MKKVVLLTVMFSMIFLACKKNTPEEKVLSLVKLEEKVIIKPEQIKKAKIGFTETKYFSFLVLEDAYYLLSTKEKVLVKFDKKGTPLCKYDFEGQGPGEFLRPAMVFKSIDGNPAVYDIMKSAILFFDKELEFLKEVKLNSSTRYLGNIGDQIIAFGDFGDYCFGKLDENFRLKEKFGNIPNKAPFDRVHRVFLYIGFFLKDRIAKSSWGYYEDECGIEILNPIDGKKELSMSWVNPHPPTQKDINKLRNFYFCYKIGKTGGYYYVLTRFTPVLKKESYRKIRVFDQKGEAVLVQDIETDLMSTVDGIPYYMKEDTSIVELMIKKKS